jgi:hypothetical protein
LCLKYFLQHCILRRDAVIKLYTDNIVTIFVVNKWVSKSPVIMAELRRLHQLCKRHGLELELHHLPSALNQYADRLSRRRRVADYLPSLEGVPEHGWVGDSEHDLKLDWIKVDLLLPPLEMLPLVPRKALSGLLQGSNARAMLAETELGPGVEGHGTQLVRPNTQSARKREALESHVDILLPSLVFTGKGERMAGVRQTRAATIAARLKSSMPPGEGEPCRMDKVAELIAEGYSDSRIQAFSTQQKRFIEFCESDGYDWLVAGKHAMCAWIVHMYETSTIADSTMEQCVSVVNRAYETNLVGWILLENQSMEISCTSKSESLSMALSMLEKSMVLLRRFLP